MTYDLHPLCVLFPRLVGEPFNILRDDIKANGLRVPIVLHDGMILDGGNRYRACHEAGVEPTFVTFGGGSLSAFVLSANLHRRHLSLAQHAAIVASAQDWEGAQSHGGNRKADQVLPGALETTKSRAAQSGASVSTQRRADAVSKADPALAQKVAHGEVSLPAAVQKVAPQLASRKPAPVKTAKQIEADKLDEDAFGGLDAAAVSEGENKALETENRELRALVDAIEAEDPKAEVIKWRRIAAAHERAASEKADNAQMYQAELKKMSNRLVRIGKLFGERDPNKIPSVVEAFYRKHTRVAA